MLRLWAAFLALMIAAPVTARADKDYDGADGGYVVYAVGNVSTGMNFDFSYHRLATPDGQPVDDAKGKMEPRLGGAIYLKIKNPDFTGEESGHVVIRRIPPGHYQVDRFFFAGWNPAGGSVRWSPARPFALPFDIRPGEATYIGSFMRAPSLGTPLQPVLGAAGFFLVADRSQRDLAIATARLTPGTKITSAVTDVSAFGSAALRTSLP